MIVKQALLRRSHKETTDFHCKNFGVQKTKTNEKIKMITVIFKHSNIHQIIEIERWGGIFIAGRVAESFQ